MIDIIILGLIQGITEWLPVSSSAQVMLFMTTVMNLSIAQALQLMIFLHAGTTLSAIVYFRKDILGIIKTLPKQVRQKNSLFYFLMISTLITGVLGFLVYGLIKEATLLPAFVLIMAVGGFLIITGLLQKYSKSKKRVRGIKKVRVMDAVVLGIFQAFSIIPGISRSGITTSILLFRRFDSHAALKLSFLMSIPVIIGAEVGMNLTENLLFSGEVIFKAVFASFFVGLVTIKALMKLANLMNFSKFCFILGGVAILAGIVTAIL